MQKDITDEERDNAELQRRKRELLKKGISKDIVALLGVSHIRLSLEEEKKIVGKAIRRKYWIE